ncbi:MAG: arginine--tRNA ligase, partial [Eubacteriales bacterium]
MKSVLEMVKGRIISLINSAAESAKNAGTLNYEGLPEFVLEVPREKEHGDFATNIAMLLARQAKMSPRQVAETLKNNINTQGSWVARIEIAGPGFINFYLNNNWVHEVLLQVEEQGEQYGNTDTGQGKMVQ